MEFGLIDGVLETEYWIHDSLPNHLMPSGHHTAICYQTDRPGLPSMIICPWYMSRVLVPEIDHMYKTDRAKYEATAHSWIQKYAMGWSLLRRQIWILHYEGMCNHAFVFSSCCLLFILGVLGEDWGGASILPFWSEQFSAVNLYNRRWKQFMHTCLKLLSLAM